MYNRLKKTTTRRHVCICGFITEKRMTLKMFYCESISVTYTRYIYFYNRIHMLAINLTRRVQYNNIKLAAYLVPTRLYFKQKTIVAMMTEWTYRRFLGYLFKNVLFTLTTIKMNILILRNTTNENLHHCYYTVKIYKIMSII